MTFLLIFFFFTLLMYIYIAGTFRHFFTFPLNHENLFTIKSQTFKLIKNTIHLSDQYYSRENKIRHIAQQRADVIVQQTFPTR